MASDYQRVACAIEYVMAHVEEQPTLGEVAGVIGLSGYHFQRLFRRWAGVSPKQFLQQLTVDRAREQLRESATVLEASVAAGLSGPGRLHDHFVTVEAMTPGEYRSGGKGLAIRHGRAETPFGEALIACTPRGICWLSFTLDESELFERWPRAAFRPCDGLGRGLFEGRRPETILHVHGTNFQLRIWRALLCVPPGDLTTYGGLAEAIGLARGAARAAGGAIAANPIAYLIPCHRVIRESGALGGYRWGLTRKQAMLAREAVG